MFPAMVATTILVFLTILFHYEALRILSSLLPRMTAVALRARVVVVVFACFAAHTVEVWLYALGYYITQDMLPDFGGLSGAYGDTLADAVYFSAVTYTSLGFGDVFPEGNTRLIAGVEALNGLVLIAWSASFTYLAMEKFWPLHAGERRR
jgi:hypothetical protein